MPVVNYKKIARQREEALFSSQDISARNKQFVKKFLDVYSVSDARKGIFLWNIRKLLSKTKDIERDMHNREKINRIFRELRDSLSMNYFTTVVNVSNRFVRWLNDGEKPKGFKDIRGIPKKQQLRQLKPDDMITWEDGLKLISATNNIQLKAVIATQLDGGFRPSEFVDLNYGDVSVKKNFVVVSVNGGKTGARPVILWRSVPYLLRWLQNHPAKRGNDPLWLRERDSQGKVKRYGYSAMQKRIIDLGKKISLKKPLDFYNLRHSACTISKMDNVPEELAAAKFGHSVDYYVNTYGRLSPDDLLTRYSNHYGIEAEAEKPRKNVSCPRCDFVNEPDSKLCEKCGAALNAKAAFELQGENNHLQEEVGALKEQLDRINSFMNRLVSQNPDVLETLASKAVNMKNHGKTLETSQKFNSQSFQV